MARLAPWRTQTIVSTLEKGEEGEGKEGSRDRQRKERQKGRPLVRGVPEAQARDNGRATRRKRTVFIVYPSQSVHLAFVDHPSAFHDSAGGLMKLSCWRSGCESE